MNKKIKTIFLTLAIIIFCPGFTTGQSILEKIEIAIPSPEQWKEEVPSSDCDSASLVRAWNPVSTTTSKELPYLWIASFEKSTKDFDMDSVNTAIVEAMKRERVYRKAASMKVDILKENNNAPKTSRLFSVTFSAVDKDKEKVLLFYILSGETSTHILSIRKNDGELTDNFIATWSAIFQAAKIIPSKIKARALWQLTLTTDADLEDEESRNELIIMLNQKLKNIYCRGISKKEVLFQNSGVQVDLKGNIDTMAIAAAFANHPPELSILKGCTLNEVKKVWQQLEALHPNPDPIIYSAYRNDINYLDNVFAVVNYKDSATLRQLLLQAIKATQLKTVTPEFGYFPHSLPGSVPVYLLHTDSVLFQQTDISSAEQSFDFKGYPAVDFTFTEQGSVKLKKATSENLGRTLAILADGRVLCAAIISETVAGGMLRLGGLESAQQAQEITALANSASAFHLTLTEIKRQTKPTQ